MTEAGSPRTAAVEVAIGDVAAALRGQRDRWRRGFTRRRLLAGGGFVGVAALAGQLATTRVAFGDPATTKRTLIVVFLRGGMDGLSVIVPAGDANLTRARRNIVVPAAALLPGDSRFGLHPALEPLHKYWKAGQMAAVHAVASPDVSRSHFQAQDCLERGAATVAVGSGWLDRVLESMGPGTTFRAVAEGSSLPRSLVGASEKLVLSGIDKFRLENAGSSSMRDKTLDTLKALYTGLDQSGAATLAAQAQNTLQSMKTARGIADTPTGETAQYPGGGFSDQLRDVAKLIRAKVGLRVAAVDLGGWDMHTGLGRVDGGAMRNHLDYLAKSLDAFATDIGPAALGDVTVVTMSEFGRRVSENGNSGTDHGHGGLMMLLGGGLIGGKVHGKWPGLSDSALDHGDLARANDYRDVLGELLATRLGVADTKKIFPGHTYQKLGVFR